MASLGPKVVLFGGQDFITPSLNDAWEWDGSSWSQKSPPTSPPLRGSYAMATLGSKVVLLGGLVIVIGGNIRFNDAWEWQDCVSVNSK